MLETTRLTLVPLTHELLLRYKNDPKALAARLKVNFQESNNDEATAADHAEAVEFWIKSTLENPVEFQWFTNWQIILKSERVIIGGIGFAGKPNENGSSEVGYGLDVRYFNKGYASEALSALIGWGFLNPALTQIEANTSINHLASQKVLLKNGFFERSRGPEFIHWQLAR